MNKTVTTMLTTAATCFLLYFLTGCKNEPVALTAQQASVVKESVQEFADSIAANITHKGPAEWLVYFKNSQEFFMASAGNIAFANYDSARSFIQNVLVKNISSINLKWSNVRIDPLTQTLASLAANFHEDITGNDGKALPYDGYFTAITEQTSQGWKLRSVHWSLVGK